MNFFYLAAADNGETPNVFALSLGVSFWTFVIFIILAVVLAKYAFPPILGYAAAREQRIQEALDAARIQREQAEQLLEEQRAELAKARTHVQEIIAEGKVAAERVRETMIQETREEQQTMLARARRDIQEERNVAIEALRHEAVELALAAAGRLVTHRMDSGEDRKIVTEFLQSVDSADGARGAGVA
jgi:F-type H+-transporting ATPase subunit b